MSVINEIRQEWSELRTFFLFYKLGKVTRFIQLSLY